MGVSAEMSQVNVADAIVVLGAAVWANGEASPTLRRRALHAADLFQKCAAPLIILSGGLGTHPPTEAAVMASLCSKAGVEPVALILEEHSTTTFENVALSAVILRKRGLSRVIVVSDTYHLPRAKMCFRYLGFETIGSAPPPMGAYLTKKRRILMSWLRELAALPWYRLTLHRQLKASRVTG